MGCKVIKIVVKLASWKEGDKLLFLQLVDLQDLYLSSAIGKQREASVGITSLEIMEKQVLFFFPPPNASGKPG